MCGEEVEYNGSLSEPELFDLQQNNVENDVNQNNAARNAFVLYFDELRGNDGEPEGFDHEDLEID